MSLAFAADEDAKDGTANRKPWVTPTLKPVDPKLGEKLFPKPSPPEDKPPH